MSRQQIQSLFPAAHWYKQRIGDDTLVRYGMQSMVIGSCSADVNFHFIDQKLVQVEIDLDQASVHQIGCDHVLLAGLQDKYGRPNHISYGPIFSEYWDRLDGGRIAIHTTEYPSIGEVTASIAYFKPDRRAAGAL